MTALLRPGLAFPPARGAGAPHALRRLAGHASVAVARMASPAPDGAARGALHGAPDRAALQALARVHHRITGT